jgi:hypothetical protein
LELREFFRDFFPVLSGEEFLDEVFALLYCIKGMTWEACLELESRERLYLLRKLSEQLKKEAASIKKASKG